MEENAIDLLGLLKEKKKHLASRTYTFPTNVRRCVIRTDVIYEKKMP